MIYTVNSSKNCVEVALFRAYIRRKPSGLLLVTVLSTLLPRPLFRSYPLDIGEAAAVGKSVKHALEALGCALPCGPEYEHRNADKREEQHAAEGHGEFKQLGGRKEFKHDSPHGLHQPCQHAAVRSDQQTGAEGYAVKQHLRLRVVWQGLL